MDDLNEYIDAKKTEIEACLNCLRPKCINCFDRRHSGDGDLRHTRAIERRAIVEKMAKDGKTDEEIARVTGLAISSVSHVRADLGLRRRPTHQDKLDRSAYVAKRVAEGAKDKVIAKEMGISDKTVGKLRRELGIWKRPA